MRITLTLHSTKKYGQPMSSFQGHSLLRQLHPTCAEIPSLPPSLLCSGGKEIYDISWSSDGRYIVSGSIDAIVCVWDVENKTKVQEFREHTHYVQGCAFDPRMMFFATLCLDRTLRVYRLNKGKSIKYHIAHAIKRREEDKASTAAAQPTAVTTSTTTDVKSKSGQVGEYGVTTSGQFTHKIFQDESISSYVLHFSPRQWYN